MLQQHLTRTRIGSPKALGRMVGLVALLVAIGPAASATTFVPQIFTTSLPHGTARILITGDSDSITFEVNGTSDVVVGIRAMYDDGLTDGDPTISRALGLRDIDPSAEPQLTEVTWDPPTRSWEITFTQDFAMLPSGGDVTLDLQWGSIDKQFEETFRFEGAIPEPTAAILFGAGGLVIGVSRGRRR